MGADLPVPATSGALAEVPALFELRRAAFEGLAEDCSNLAVTGFDAVYVEDCGDGVDPLHLWVKTGTDAVTGRIEIGAQTVFTPELMGFFAFHELDATPDGWTLLGAGAIMSNGTLRSGAGGPVALFGTPEFVPNPDRTLVVWFVANSGTNETVTAELGAASTDRPPDLDEGWTYVSSADVSTRIGEQLLDVRAGDRFITGPGRFRASVDRETRTLAVGSGFTTYQSPSSALQSTVYRPYVGLKGTQVEVERIILHPTALREVEAPVYDGPITTETGAGTGSGGSTSSGLTIVDPGCQCGHTPGTSWGVVVLAGAWSRLRRLRRLLPA